MEESDFRGVDLKDLGPESDDGDGAWDLIITNDSPEKRKANEKSFKVLLADPIDFQKGESEDKVCEKVRNIRELETSILSSLLVL